MPETPLIFTSRTIIHSIHALTLDQIRILDIDPEIMRYITNGKPRTTSESEQWLKIKLTNYKKHGFGLMPAFQKTDNQFIGWGVLKHLEDSSEVELGYRLDKRFWGQGLATEISRGVIDYAKNVLGLRKLVAVTDLENEASQKVLLKCGFSHVSEAFYYNVTVDYFELKL